MLCRRNAASIRHHGERTVAAAAFHRVNRCEIARIRRASGGPAHGGAPADYGIPKILIESGCFKFSENMSRIHLENGQNGRRRKNTVFNWLC
jgi:hypothetical protein